jgi:anthranilate 1,2-dioxygenase small subunit
MQQSSAELRHQLRDLYEDYAACLDELDLERWPDFFTDHALYRVMSKGNFDAGLTHALIYCDGMAMIRDRVVAIRETTVYEPRVSRHFLSGVHVTSESGDIISATSNFVLVETRADSEPYVSLGGRYVDSVVRRSDAWRFQERCCVLDNYRIHTSLVFPV